ncbi:transposase [Pseudoalteromonas sp. C2R02]|nr:transposase [Pseudoalteromonas sp. C2R02]
MWCSCTNLKSDEQVYTRFAGYLKDCKVCPLQSQCMRKAPIKTVRQVQFLNDRELKTPSYKDKMRIKIDSLIGRRQYGKRLGAIEPVFGNITVNKGMNKFTLRGQEKVNAQWQMYCLVHNIEKLCIKPTKTHHISFEYGLFTYKPLIIYDLVIKNKNQQKRKRF